MIHDWLTTRLAATWSAKSAKKAVSDQVVEVVVYDTPEETAWDTIKRGQLIKKRAWRIRQVNRIRLDSINLH